MKKFLFDTLLDEENICNLTQERKIIEKAITNGKKLVIYGPRNSGKTSLVKNSALKRFKNRHKDGFVFFVDLMEVKDLPSIHRRISREFEIAFRESFPAKHLMEAVRKFLASLLPQITLAEDGRPSLSLTPQSSEKIVPLQEIFATLQKIGLERPTVIVLDEFQDIAFVDEAEGFFRQVFQEIKEIPIIIMGSKRHILGEILAKPNAPLAMFGEDLEFHPIPYEEYHAYILERFRMNGLTLSLDDSKYLQDLVLRVPEAINIVCAEINDSMKNQEIGKTEIDLALRQVVDKRRSRYEEYLSHFSAAEESVMVALAKEGPVKHPNSQTFLKKVKPTSRMVGIIIKNLRDKSVVDGKEEGYALTDPLLTFYLKSYR